MARILCLPGMPQEPGDEERDRLLAVAREAMGRAYAPYSRFPVGAAILTAAGGTYAGCNVENASYGLTICAERSAVFGAVAAEGPDLRVRAVAVVAASADAPCTPCGACRQVIAEFGPTARVIFRSGGELVVMRADELLPARFELDP